MSVERTQKPWRRKLIALALSTIVSLILAELVCRMLYGAPMAERLPLMEARANPRRGYEMLPSSDHYTYLEPVHVNALGLRGPELGPRSADERIVLCLGDSFVYGQGVSETDTLPAQIERELAGMRPNDELTAAHSKDDSSTHSEDGRTSGVTKDGPHWRALNGGLRAYNTVQELALLEELLPKVHPDAVVLFWFANDLEEPDLAKLAAALERSGPVVFDVNARMEGSVEFHWHLRQLARSSALLMKLHDVWADAHYQDLDTSEREQAFEHLRGYFSHLREQGEREHFRPLVALVPVNRSLAAADPSEALYARCGDLARAARLETLDLLPDLKALYAEQKRLPVLAYDGHYDARANAVMAKAVARVLAAH